ncbi:MAG: Gfo/Idh/MocA family protein [Steroidobacteraceae bacterium]
MKVRAQYHMNREFTSMPAVDERPLQASRLGVGLIGCGNFAYSTIAYYLRREIGDVIVGCMDTHSMRAASLCRDFRGRYYTTDAQRVIYDKSIGIVYIASNHASHAEYAIAALGAGKAVHIEKPHVVSMDQLRRLCVAVRDTGRPVGLGFNRPNSKLGRLVTAALVAERQPMVMNWFVAGHELPSDHWYFKEEEGGRVLGNLCHWTDFILRMVPRERRYPIRIVPARSSQSDCNIGVSFVFADGSVGVITFSAMGHTFEGVRERFSAHCGNVICHLDDFQHCTIENVSRRNTVRGRLRDHGHREAIIGSYSSASGSGADAPPDVSYIWETGELFVRTKQALEENREIEVGAFSNDLLSARASD